MKSSTKMYLFLSLFSLVFSSCAGNENADSSTQFNQAAADSALTLANASFYEALNTNFTGNTAPLEAIWSHNADVSDQGPFGARLDGWEAVNAQFKKEGGMKLGGKVVCKDLIVRAGKELGYTVCVEEGENMSADGQPVIVRFRATNIFRLENGEWKMVHHHTDISKPLETATGSDNDAPEAVK